jgi:hypothetical protein
VLRYYLIALAIVALAGGLVYAHRIIAPDLEISAQPTGTPTVETRVPDDAAATPRPFTGQGPWVLSALPACFDEQSRVRGPIGELQATFPPGADRIAPGTVVRQGGCTLIVRERDIWVERGGDRLRVPPEAALYRVAGHLVLTARDGNTVEIRRY